MLVPSGNYEAEKQFLRDAMARTGPGRSGVPVYEAMIASDDFHEGIKAFVERREPVWKAK